ncbi:MAG: MFS transporter [Nostocoides sp.]
MTGPLAPAVARRVYLTLTVTRWFPVGLVIGLFSLLALERGLSVAQTTSYAAFSGIVVFLLELPTSGFADAVGRRPVLLVAGVVNIGVGLLYLRAHTFWGFVVAAMSMGVYRALDSGPMDAWFVDTVHATEPDAEVAPTLSVQSAVLSGAIGAGAVVSGILVAWHPITGRSALELPLMAFVGLNVVHLVLTASLLREFRPATSTGAAERGVLASVREVPHVIGSGLNLLRRNKILAGLVTVEFFWVTAMTVFETFQPIRLSELLGSESRAGEVLGPAAAGAWAMSALGAALIARVSGRIGVVRAAIACRILNGLGAAAMGLATGVAGLITAYLLTYAVHGAGGPMHSTLLHREADATNRSTVLSMNSMVMFVGGALVSPLLGLLAQTTSTPTAMVTAGLVSVLGFWFYRPALRRERR